MSRGLRICLTGVLSTLLLSVIGCRQAALFAGAAVSQGPLRRVGNEPAGQWTFHGLDARVSPRLRPGSYPTATRGVPFLGPSIGPHSYTFDWAERSGIVYTCRAGHVDIAHVRKGADWTGYLAALVLDHLEKGRTSFRLKQVEPSVYHVDLTVPEYWTDLDRGQQERIAREISRELGQYLAWTGLTWHEILTWFGYRFKAYKSEFPSAFSWEDSYSNLLGTHIGVAALRDEERPFSEAVAQRLEWWLAELGVQSAQASRQAAESVRDRWYSSGWFSTKVHERNFDVGLDDGSVTPRRIPGIAVCDAAKPRLLAVPTLDGLARYGFTVKLEIETKVWEKKRILAAAYPDGVATAKRIDPVIHFPRIIRHMERACAAWDVSYADAEGSVGRGIGTEDGSGVD